MFEPVGRLTEMVWVSDPETNPSAASPAFPVVPGTTMLTGGCELLHTTVRFALLSLPAELYA